MTTGATPCFTVVSPGVQTTVQDGRGRSGYWDVGVPPSGAWDDLDFALANAAVGNDPNAAGLEAVMVGPTITFERRALVCVTGAAFAATVNGRPLARGRATPVSAGALLEVGPCGPPGIRAYVAVAGGIAVPQELGSRSTFVLGGFGGVEGRALQAGDTLHVGREENLSSPVDVASVLPAIGDSWDLHVLPGPHGAPEHLLPDGVEGLFAATWTVDHRADRTGIRLVGPTPKWARTDGGEAGLHPSNLHDSAYPVGGIMLSGDTPVIVGPDGPSLGGFVVPCVVIRSERWKLAQLRPGDTVRLVPVNLDVANERNSGRAAVLSRPHEAVAAATAESPIFPYLPSARSVPRDDIVLAELPAEDHRPAVVIRRAGDHHVLLEAGPPLLDLTVRVWVHLLAQALRARHLDAVTELVEGVRSILVSVVESRLPLPQLAALLVDLAQKIEDPLDAKLDVREVTLPIAFDDPRAHEAMQRYQRSVRPDAPWCPDNVEFIRRINDLDQRGDVFDVVQAATYLVVGLGDVYLGAPVAVPIDPRHRLVTTKYDPARTWTPQNAVGIGGVYLCVYGMEGPGGYQLVGRTVPVWHYVSGSDEKPWLLRQFDKLRFEPVSVDELADLRAGIKAGTASLDVRPSTFSLAESLAIEREHESEIDIFRKRREAAFAAERERWDTA